MPNTAEAIARRVRNAMCIAKSLYAPWNKSEVKETEVLYYFVRRPQQWSVGVTSAVRRRRSQNGDSVSAGHRSCQDPKADHAAA